MFCPCQRFLHKSYFQSTLFLLFNTLSQSTLITFYVFSSLRFLLFDILSMSTFVILDVLSQSAFFSNRHFVPFVVFSFDVLSIDVFYRWRFLLRILSVNHIMGLTSTSQCCTLYYTVKTLIFSSLFYSHKRNVVF
jgi:hypothetical protein